MNTALLHISNLSIGYKSSKENYVVVDGITTSLLSGEFVVLLGSNGVGKSTLLRTICDLQPPLNGEVTFNGERLKELSVSQRASTLGVIFTGKEASTLLTVQELVLSGRLMYSNFLGNYSHQDIEIAVAVMKEVGVYALRNRRLNQLSDGELRKAMIARLLAQDAQLLLLDEPTAFLDYPGKIELMQLLLMLCKKRNKSVIISTHDVELSLQIATNIWLINNEKQFVSGSTNSLIQDNTISNAFDRKGVLFDKNSKRFLFHNQS